jgi:cell wall-associated NlpC family hydrolase
MYGVGYERLAQANPGFAPERLAPGVAITIPARIAKPKEALSPGQYKIENGDTDWSIARRYGIEPKELRKMNPGTDWLKLQIGQTIAVPIRHETAPSQAPARPTMASAPPKAAGTHTVVSGESDWVVARRYGMTVRQLHDLNPGVNWSALPIRTKLNVSAAAPGTSAAKITTKRARITRSDVIVRAGARQDSRRIAIVSLGRIASVRDRIGDWYKLAFDGGTVGWVRGDLLAPVSASTVYAAERTSPRPRPEGAALASAVRPRAGSTPRSQQYAAAPKREPQTYAMRDVSGGSLLDTAMANLGVRYRWGGTSRSGFDCSGFTTHVFKAHGKSLPRTSAEQSRHGQAVDKGALAKGDLVFFKTTRGSRVSHVGIYVGDGKFIHASSGSGKVVTSSLNEGYYSRRYAGARRVANVGPTGATAKDPAERGAGAKPKAPPKAAESPIQDTVEAQIEAEKRPTPSVPDAVGR